MATAATYDPVSVEIHRRALDNITAEMAITLVRTSGSPVVYEVKDFATCLMDRRGEHLSMSSAVIFHAGSSLIGTQAVIKAAEDAGIEPRPGDGWVINDPFESGAMHQADITIIMPQFYGEEHVGWAFSNVHVADIGGMGISGFAPGAVSVYDEGLRFGPTPIIKDGALDPVWEQHLRDNVRAADLVLNDVRGMMAANNVAQQKLIEVIDRFGLERFEEYCEVNKGLTEDALRERIAKLPDGVYEGAEWAEFDGHGPDQLFEFRVKMTVSGSDLHFEFSGSPQADAFINANRGVVYGCMMSAVLTVLCYGDMPFNAGIWRPFTIDLGERGTVVNAELPAPVSAGHAIGGLRIIKVVKDVLNQACGLSEDEVIRGRVGGIAADACGLYPLTGKGHGGHPVVVFFMDNNTGNGGGAQSTFDGQDCYGATCLPGTGLNSIETNESTTPTLYLWRKLMRNSGGPGIYRGGQALQSAISVYGTDRLAGGMTLFCAEAAAHGIGGGAPGATGHWSAAYGTNIEAGIEGGELPTPETITGDVPTVPSHLGRLRLEHGDLLRVAGNGGGGAGDPLLRDPEAVAKDVRDGYVTASHARSAYGVAVADGAVDGGETTRLRAEIRRRRLGADPAKEQGPPEMAGVAVTVGDDGHWHCAYCESDLGPHGEDWRARAVTTELPTADRFEQVEMYIRRREGDTEFMLQEHCCPDCAGLLLSQSYPNGVERAAVARLAG